MKSSAGPPSNLATTSGRNGCTKSYPCIPAERKALLCSSTARRKRKRLYIGTSVFRNKLNIRDNGASESARARDRFLVLAQKLEEKMTGNAQVAYDIDLGINLGTLESDLQAALESLKRKEEDLHEAERAVILERSELSCVKDEVDVRVKEIAVVCSNQEKLENELRQSSLKQISQENEIQELELRVKEREQQIASMQSALCSKEEQLYLIRNELMLKNEEVAKVEIDLQVKAQLLNDTEDIVRRQETELLKLQGSLKVKERDLDIASTHRKLEEERAKTREAVLSKQMMAWLLAQEELRELGEEASTHMEDFERVKKLLVTMRSELVCSQKSLASSRQRMEEQQVLLKGQCAELEEQKKCIMTHMMSLKEAHAELDNERSKLRVAEAHNKKLEQCLLIERDLVHSLQKELQKEKTSAFEATEEVSFLGKELEKKRAEFEETSSLLYLKELELREARLEIQHLKSELSSLEHALEERDSELHIARKRLDEVNAEITELRMLMKTKEDQLMQATALLKEKDVYAHVMQGELNAAKLKLSEAEQVVERIVNLSNKLVASVEEEYSTSLDLNAMEQLTEKPTDYHQWQMNDLDTEVESARGSLRMKEMKVLAIQRSLNIKDEELLTVSEKLDEKEAELKRANEEMPNEADELKSMHSLAQGRIKETTAVDLSIDLSIDKLRLEAAELELEAATIALHRLEQISRELVGKLCFTTEADSDTKTFSMNGSDPLENQTENNCLTVFSSEVARLSKLTERLVIEAGIH